MSQELRIADYDDFLAASSTSKAEQVIKLELASNKIEERLQTLRAELLAQTKELGVISLKTEGYSVTRATRDTLKIANNEAICKELEDMNIPILTERTLVKSSKDQLKLAIKNGQMFNNAEISSTEYIAIRVNKE